MGNTIDYLPDGYFYLFTVYEPLLCFLGLIGAFLDPNGTYAGQAPTTYIPTETLPMPALLTLLQLAHVCALVGLLNLTVLPALRHLPVPLARYLCVLLVGDVCHLAVTLYVVTSVPSSGPWFWSEWGAGIWATVCLGATLLIPRLMWVLGIGRPAMPDDLYAPHEDGAVGEKEIAVEGTIKI